MHHQGQSQYHNSILIKLNEPTDFTPSLLKAALAGLKSIYKQGYFYKKAGVIALGIIPKDHKQFDFFTDNSESRIMAENKLMQTVDRVNIKVGEDTIKYAVEGTARGWWMQQTQRSQRYTTNWQELLKVRAE
jgi:DNA polymerase V